MRALDISVSIFERHRLGMYLVPRSKNIGLEFNRVAVLASDAWDHQFRNILSRGSLPPEAFCQCKDLAAFEEALCSRKPGGEIYGDHVAEIAHLANDEIMLAADIFSDSTGCAELYALDRQRPAPSQPGLL